MESKRPLWEKLTPREQALLGWLKMGLTYKEIAPQMDVSTDYVKKMTALVAEKIAANNRIHAIVILLEEKHAAERRCSSNE
jgi:DNA-binding NarL/FixJ family response regulator